MGKLDLKASTLSGTPSKSSWAQAQIFDEKLFACISIEGPEDFDARTEGRRILSDFKEAYYNANAKPYEALTRSLSELYDFPENVFFDFTAAVLYRDVLYVGKIGAGGAKIFRNGKIFDLFKKNGQTKEASVASGFVKINDIFLLYTSSFLLDISPEELTENIKENYLVSEVSDRLAPFLMKGEKSSTKAVLLMGAYEADLEIVEEIKQEIVEPAPIEKKRWPTPLIFLKKGYGENNNTKRLSFTVAIVLLAMLALSIFWGVKKRDEDNFKRTFAPLYKEAQDQYDEGSSLLELNPGLSKVPLTEAKKKTDDLLKLVSQRKVEKQMVLDLSKKIDEAIAGSLKTYKISEPTLFYDLTILGDKATGAGWSIYDLNALIFDSNNNSAYSVGLTGKSGGIVAGGDDLKGVSKYAMGDRRAYFLSDSGVMVSKIGEKGVSTIIKKDDEWGNISLMGTFGANLYLVDSGKSKIWKYVGGDSGFSSKSNYFAGDVSPDLSKATRILVDGSLWIMTSDGDLLRYTNGRVDQINLSGLSENIGELSDFYVDENTKYLYILDKPNKRVVLFDKKSGVYFSQYQWGGLDKIVGMAADEAGKKIFLLVGTKIYSIELK